MDEIEEIVLQDIKLKAKLVLENEEQVRNDFLRKQEKDFNEQTKIDNMKLKSNSQRLDKIEKLIRSTYEDKVSNKIPEDICISLLNNYVKEKEQLQEEISAINNRLQETKQKTKDVEEFIRRVKKYIQAPKLTREMTMELIEFVTIDKFPQDKTTPRTIHIYYKLIDNVKGDAFKLNKRNACL